MPAPFLERSPACSGHRRVEQAFAVQLRLPGAPVQFMLFVVKRKAPHAMNIQMSSVFFRPSQIKFVLYACLLLLFFVTQSVQAANVLQVGWGKKYLMPSIAAKFARDGDIVEIDAGTYEKDAAIWRQNNLTIRAVNGRAHLKSDGVNAGGKGIWVIKGNNVTVENMEFSGARVSHGNGAGIRIEGAGLTLRNCYFHDNQNGILGGHKDGEIIIERSEFARNGKGDGQTHNIYIGKGKRFVLKHSYSHHARIGHNVKSRAQQNVILYNRIMDEESGTSSYAIDLPNGGLSFVIGNEIQQGQNTDNATVVSYGAERLSNQINALYFVNNTVVNDRKQGGRFLFAKPGASPVRIVNNLFIGKARIEAKDAEMRGNVFGEKNELAAASQYNYRLAKGSKAINAGTAAGMADDIPLNPEFEYRHPMGSEPRKKHGGIDAGAHESAYR